MCTRVATPIPPNIVEAHVPEREGNKRMRIMENLSKQTALTKLFKSLFD